GEVDYLVDDRRVHRAGDDRDRPGVARRRLGVLAGQVAVLAEAGPDPRVLQVGRAGHLAQLGQRDVRDHLRVGPGPAGDEPGAEQEFAGELESVVEAFSFGAVVFRARLLPQGFYDRADRR